MLVNWFGNATGDPPHAGVGQLMCKHTSLEHERASVSKGAKIPTLGKARRRTGA